MEKKSSADLQFTLDAIEGCCVLLVWELEVLQSLALDCHLDPLETFIFCGPMNKFLGVDCFDAFVFWVPCDLWDPQSLCLLR